MFRLHLFIWCGVLHQFSLRPNEKTVKLVAKLMAKVQCLILFLLFGNLAEIISFAAGFSTAKNLQMI